MKKIKSVLFIILLVIILTLFFIYINRIIHFQKINYFFNNLTLDEFNELRSEYEMYVNNSIEYPGAGDLGDYSRLSDIERKMIIYSLENLKEDELTDIKKLVNIKYNQRLNISKVNYLGINGRRKLRNDIKFVYYLDPKLAKDYELGLIIYEETIDNLGHTGDIPIIDNDNRTLREIYADDTMYDLSGIFLIISILINLYFYKKTIIKKEFL